MELKFRIYNFLMKNNKKWTVKELSKEIGMDPLRLDLMLKKLTRDYENIKVRQGVLCEEYYWEGEKND